MSSTANTTTPPVSEKQPESAKEIFADPPKKASTYSFRRAFTNIIWPRRALLSVGLILVAINSLAGLVSPGASKYLLDNVVPEKNMALLYLIIAVVAGAILIQTTTSFLLVRYIGVGAQKLIAELRAQVQQQIIHLPIKYFDNTQSGSLVSRVMTDVEGVRNLVGTGLVQLFGGTITSVGAFIIMLGINWKLTLMMLLPLIGFAFVALKAFAKLRPIFRERGKILADVTGRLTESLGGIRIVKGFHAEKHEVDVFEGGVMRVYENVKSSMTGSALVQSLATLIIGLSTVGALGYAGKMMMEGTMTSGDLIAFLLYLGVMVVPIVQMSNIGSQITEALAGLDRTEEILQMAKETDDPRRTQEAGTINGAIQFDNVSFAYEKGKEVLHEISFKAAAGSVTALVGSSGSGKTTIAGLAATFLNPDKGTITVDGKDLSTLTLDSYRAQLGVVLQDDFLFEGTIRENILFSRPDASEEDLQMAIDAAYVSEFTDRFDDGLETVIGERGVKLSGGQRQRIAIARAILANPRVLILDEATSNLDNESEKYIQMSLTKLLAGRTTFVIAHRLSTIRKADQILVIEDGNIAERGTHDELIAAEGRYHELYTYQSRI